MCYRCVKTPVYNYSKNAKVKYDSSWRYHADNEPAIIDKTLKEWWHHGKRHREDGPAITDSTYHWLYGDIFTRLEWYYDGKKLSCSTQEEFERFMKMKVFW